jgi:protein Tex
VEQRDVNIPQQLIAEFKLQPFQVENTLGLFNEGATVPFIARYRKEMTGSLDEVQIRDLQHRHDYYKELDERRETILASIKEQEKLTPELEAKIQNALLKTELEDLYLPYKPKRFTRATKAKDAGLEPLSQWLLTCAESAADPLGQAASFVNPEKGYDSPQKALQGAQDILAEAISDNADVRKLLRLVASADGVVTSVVKKEFKDRKTKFEMYYDFKEKVKALVSHRIMAMFRGEHEKVLRVSLELPFAAVAASLESKFIRHPGSATAQLLKATVRDSYERLLLPATETEIRIELREKAEEEAFLVFDENLTALLLSPPAGRKAVLGIDPGFRSGCKVAALDNTGKFLEYQTIFPHEPHRKASEAGRSVLDMIARHSIQLIAIGNGTASRETDDFIRNAIAALPAETSPVSVVVNESGASVYSASEAAAREFPEFDVTVRGAISIARRLQDPLAELVKIDPKAIGVGQYQHDVNQYKLKSSLEEVVESCVNRVGVDINLASEELLKYVSGLNKSLAARIVACRNENGAFDSREALKKVPGMGEKTFVQSAGFLRIAGAKNPLDNSAVHPERYGLVQAMAARHQTTVNQLIGNSTLVRSIDKKSFVSDAVGLPTINDIVSELEKPGRDPRAIFAYARFSRDVREVSDVKEGMRLEGTVTNVTNFGAFVDIGVHQDGLVHISEMADSFVSDPKKVAYAGQIVNVRVLKVDPVLKRISLSMKSGGCAQKTRPLPSGA